MSPQKGSRPSDRVLDKDRLVRLGKLPAKSRRVLVEIEVPESVVMRVRDTLPVKPSQGTW